MKNLYVGNLDFAVTNDQLRALFEPFGAVETATVVIDRDTGRSRGFGFVEMADNSEAGAAITALNQTLLGERVLTINEARLKDNRGGRRQTREQRKPGRELLATRAHRKHRY
ncbi:MAG: RNA-binding protein [Acidobacteria bacterium]|nr:MAG: RNA-binding protein [Acidobacteriota bacterium]